MRSNCALVGFLLVALVSALRVTLILPNGVVIIITTIIIISLARSHSLLLSYFYLWDPFSIIIIILVEDPTRADQS